MSFGLAILLFIGVVGLWLALLLWPLHKIAVWLKTGRSGYGACFLALVVSALVGGAAAAASVLAGISPVIAGVGAFLAQLFVFSALLQTSMFRGFVVSLLSAVASVLLTLVLGLTLGGLGVLFGPGEAMSMSWGDAAGPPIVSQETEDGDRIVQAMKSHASTGPGGALRPAADPMMTDATPLPPTTKKPDGAREKPKKRQVTYEWKAEELTSLRVHVGRRVRLTTAQRIRHHGELVRTDRGLVVVKKRLSGGSIEFSIPKRDIELVEVWTKVLI